MSKKLWPVGTKVNISRGSVYVSQGTKDGLLLKGTILATYEEAEDEALGFANETTEDYPYKVEWESGHKNYYQICDLNKINTIKRNV